MMASPLPSSEFASRSLCIFFTMGKCQRGDSCSFTHTSNDDRKLSEPVDLAEQNKESPPQPICRNWRNGTCSWGSECRFVHGPHNEDDGEHTASSSSSSDDISPQTMTPDNGNFPSLSEHGELSSTKTAEELDWPTENFPKDEEQKDDPETSFGEEEISTFRTDDVTNNAHDGTTIPEISSCTPRIGEESITKASGEENDLQPEDSDSLEGTGHVNAVDHPMPLPMAVNEPPWVQEDVETTPKSQAPQEEGDISLGLSETPMSTEDFLSEPSSEDTSAPDIIDPSNSGALQPVTHDEASDFYNPDAAFADAYDGQLDHSSYNDLDPTLSEASAPPAGGDVVTHWSEYADPLANLMIPFCKFFAQAKCSQGAACRFRHSLTVKEYEILFRNIQPLLWTSDVQLSRGEIGKSTASSSFSVCKFYPLGKCRNGTSCPYLHIPPATPDGPSASPSARQRDEQEQPSTNTIPIPIPTPYQLEHRTQTRPCKYYTESGNCSWGDKCYYSHDIAVHQEPFRLTGDQRWTNSPGPRKESQSGEAGYGQARPCKWFREGHCRRSDNCLFLHDSPGAEETVQSESNSVVEEMASGKSDDGWGSNAEGWGSFVDEWAKLEEAKNDSESKQVDDEPPASRRRLLDDKRDSKPPQCQYYAVSRCKKGSRCNFSHDAPVNTWAPKGGSREARWGDEELPENGGWPPQEGDPWAPKKPTLCMYYFRGYCRKGDRCNLSHNSPQSGTPHNATSKNQTPSRSPLPSKYPVSAEGDSRAEVVDEKSSGTWEAPEETSWGANEETVKQPAPAEDDARVEVVVDEESSNTWEAPEETFWGANEETVKQPAPAEDDGWPDTESESEFVPWATPQKPICYYYAKGHCTKGTRCTLRHESPETKVSSAKADLEPVDEPDSLPFEEPPAVEDEARVDPVATVNDMDLTAQSYTLTDENGTSLPHSSDEDEKTWDVEWSNESNAPLAPLKIQKTCKAFGQGYCPLGDSCLYQHIIDMDAVVGAPERDSALIEPIEAEGSVHSDGTQVPAMQEIPMDDTPVPEVEPELVVERDMFNCTVRFGLDNGCAPTNITAASESCRVIISNLPPDISNLEAVELAETIDDLEFGHEDIARIESSEAGVDIMIKFVTSQDAVKAVTKLHGQTYDSRPLTARLVTENVMAPLECKTVKITWSAPSRSVWAYYPQITIAKTHEKRLDGLTFQGRKIKASFGRPRPQDKTFAVKISNLPVDTDKAALEELLKASLVHLNGPTYVGCPLYEIRDTLDSRGSLERFYRLPLDPKCAKHMAFARFDAGLPRVLEAHGVSQPFLGDGSLSLQKVFHANYKISERRYQAVRGALEQLRETYDALRVYDGEEPVDIHLYADAEEGATFGTVNREVQEALQGQVMMHAESKVPVWDEYFDISSSARAIEAINGDTSYFVKLDPRRQLIRLLGDESSRARAQGILLKLLKKVRAQRHVVPLDLPALRLLVDGGYKTLQDTLGAHKVTLDVAVPELVVRGDADLQRAKVALAATASSAHNDVRTPSSGRVGTRSDSATCPICRRAPRSAISLPCGHVYCTPCLQHVLHGSAGLHFTPPRCIAGCAEYVPYTVVRDLLPTVAEATLLRGAFLAHVRARPKEFFFCPTPHCETVYRLVAGERSGGSRDSLAYMYVCPTCAVKVCARCRWEYHEGVDCTAPVEG